MSWSKRPGGGSTGAPVPEQQPPPVSQQYAMQQTQYPNYQSGLPATSAPQHWPAQQQPPMQYNQQYSHVYQQQPDYTNNTNQFYQQQPQQQQFQQNFNQGFANVQQGYQQANYYQNTQQNHAVQQPTHPQGNVNNDGWEENWNWGWEDASKQAQKLAAQNMNQAPPESSQQAYNNANVIEDSFASNESWNWSMEDKKNKTIDKPPIQPLEPESSLPVVENLGNTNDKNSQERRASIDLAQVSEDVKTLDDRDAVKEHLPKLALGKRYNIENLTPQWSIESQMSQYSSDGPPTHSESTYRSENQSRNSNNSPGFSMEPNYTLPGADDDLSTQNTEWPRRSSNEKNANPTTINKPFGNELSNALQEMHLANCENPTPDDFQINSVSAISTASSTHDPQNTLVGTSQPQVHQNFETPNVPPPALNMPPTTQGFSSQNPFKHAGPFSHIAKLPPPPQSSTGSNLMSPAAVSKVHQKKIPAGFGANLETTPDNSERPDQPHVAFRSIPGVPLIPENFEVAPRNDRNEYLQTAHLSPLGDYSENRNFSHNLPPPGLKRMVVGQQETEYNSNSNMSSDEPPPGLARLVPGQQTENDNDGAYNRYGDGQPTGSDNRPFRQADGQQTPDYSQTLPSNERRPIGFDRIVPGEFSNNEYSQFDDPNFVNNEQRVVTGVDYDYQEHSSAVMPELREQVDGSDYMEHETRNRNIIGSLDAGNEATDEYPVPPENSQRGETMEGENLQDLSAISSAELSFSRDLTLDGAGIDVVNDRRTDASDSIEVPAPTSRRQSGTRGNTSEDESERDRTFKSSPRRDRDKDKHKPPRDREKDREPRHNRDERKVERDAGRGDRSTRAERSERRSTRSRRYDTEDTDYNSDRERDRRRNREGSYVSSKPPRPEDKDRRYDDRDRNRRYHTIERDRRYDDERDGSSRRRSDRHRDRYEPRYRDIDPSRKYGNIRREEEERKRVVTFSTESTAYNDSETKGETGSGGGSDAETEKERRRVRQRPHRHHRQDYYEGYGAGYEDPYLAQRRQLEYYERLRLSDPVAYMQLYKQALAAQPHGYYRDPALAGYERTAEDRGSLHSGRSSANLKGTDTFCGGYRAAAGSLRDAPSLRTDGSDRDFNTDASLNLQLEQSTVRSERMTPFKFATAHVKGSLGAGRVVLVSAAWPVDGQVSAVRVAPVGLLRRDPQAQELAKLPSPLRVGSTHKKSVLTFCEARARQALQQGGTDAGGRALLWDLLALTLRQNGVVVGTDIAELLLKNVREYEYRPQSKRTYSDSSKLSRGSSVDGLDQTALASLADMNLEETTSPLTPADEKAAMDKLRELLIYGNQHEALEHCMATGLWGFAFELSALVGARARASARARFVTAVPRSDPLHSLLHHAAHRPVPAASCVSDGRWGDWRPHAAILLANPTAKPDCDRHSLIQIGDSLQARGLIYSAQFCFVSGGAPFARHPLAPFPLPSAPAPAAPPRLSLLLADPRAPSLGRFATEDAIFATEVYEYALSLNRAFVIEELQVYKLIMATRLLDCGLAERALGYLESAAAGVTRSPEAHAPRFLAQLAALHHRLQHCSPAEAADSPRDVDAEEQAARALQFDDVAEALRRAAEASASAHSSLAASLHATPSHAAQPPPAAFNPQQEQPQQPQPWQHEPQAPDWQEQANQYGQYEAPVPTYAVGDGTPSETNAPHDQNLGYYKEEWGGPEDSQLSSQGYDQYAWQDNTYSYGEQSGAEPGRPAITMPGAAPARSSLFDDYGDDSHRNDNHQQDFDSSSASKASDKKQDSKKEDGSKQDSKGKGGGWLGGIFNKLSLKAPNQMILPDDKNPSIVWDEAQKRWRSADGEEPASQPPPPPPTAALHANAVPPSIGGVNSAPPLSAPNSNMFKMQKGRQIKKSYVDVFNPGGGGGAPQNPAPAPLLLSDAPPTYFVPQGGIYDPTQAANNPDDLYNRPGN